jgi:hypothetical protein
MTTKTQTDQEMTDEYCETIAQEIRDLEIILSGGEYTARRSSPIVELFNTMAEQAEEERDNYTASVTDYLNAYCMEFKTLGERSGSNDWEVTGHKILRSFGGPNCWITDTGAETVLIEVFWGGCFAQDAVYAPAFVEALGDIEL